MGAVLHFVYHCTRELDLDSAMTISAQNKSLLI
jgi:hypothetical protein